MTIRLLESHSRWLKSDSELGKKNTIVFENELKLLKSKKLPIGQLDLLLRINYTDYYCYKHSGNSQDLISENLLKLLKLNQKIELTRKSSNLKLLNYISYYEST